MRSVGGLTDSWTWVQPHSHHAGWESDLLLQPVPGGKREFSSFSLFIIAYMQEKREVNMCTNTEEDTHTCLDFGWFGGFWLFVRR